MKFIGPYGLHMMKQPEPLHAKLKAAGPPDFIDTQKIVDGFDSQIDYYLQFLQHEKYGQFGNMND